MKTLAQKWDEFLTLNEIATDDEIRLVGQVAGYNEETMMAILYARTALRSYTQCLDEGYQGTEELDCYYGIGDEKE